MYTTKFYTRDGKVHFTSIDKCDNAVDAINKTIVALDADGDWLIAGVLVIKKSDICAFEIFAGEA